MADDLQQPPVQQMDTTQVQAPTQLQDPGATDPAAGINPAVMGEIQRQQQSQQPPKMGGKPLLLDYIQNMIKGSSQASPLSAPTSRGDMTLNFMGQFLSNLSQGLAQAGHGPGANTRGAAAAMQAPYQRDLQQYQMQQEAQTHQSQIEAEQARTAQQQAQTEQLKTVVQTPYGPMSQKLAEKVFPAAIRKEGMENVADTRAASAANDPIKKGLRDAASLLDKGDMDGYKAKLKEVSELSSATKAPPKDSEISLIQKANGGDKEALAAWNKLQSGRIAVRAASQAQKPMTYYDAEQGRNVTLGAGEAEAMQKAGKNLIPAGTVPANTLLQMQKAQSSIPTAIEDVSKNLSAWDNASDRAIFAKVMKDSPMGGDPSTWFGNVLAQAANSGLSEDGMQALTKLRTLNESLGTLRAISGLPSTAGSMMATVALMPGATTPNSKMAKMQLDQIKTLVERETGVPFLGGSGEGKSKVPPAAGSAMDRLNKKYLK